MPHERTVPQFSIRGVIATIVAGALALAGCGSSANTFTSPTGLSKCAVNTEASASTLPASGGTASINVTTERECQWTASPEGAWLKVTAGNSGQGPGTVQLAATENADPVTRTAAVVVNDKRVQVTQEAGQCRADLDARSASFSPAGGTGRVEVRASSSLCTWTAASEVDWIAITSGSTGKGSAPVTFNVATTSGLPRVGTIKIAGLTFTVDQSEGCGYAIAPATYAAGSSGGSMAVTVSAGPGCPWTAASNASWISIATPSGSGPGTVAVTVAATNGPPRTGTATIAGQTFTVTQSPGCAFDVTPLSLAIEAAGGTRSVNVSTGESCAWTAASQAPWINITAGTSGSGRGSVSFTAAATTGGARTGTLIVAGQTVTVVQSEGCTFTVAPQTLSVASSGGSSSVNVTSGSGCAWTAASQASWITIASGASGSGNGTVTVNAAGTSGPARSGTLTVAGRTVTVNQGQGCTFALSPTTASAPSGGTSGRFEVRSGDGCGWSAASNASWLTVTAGSTGSGNGSVQYAAAANNGPSRTGTITAGDRTFTVTQDAGCSFSLSASTQNIGSGGGTTAVGVTAPGGCSWTATSNASWIGISSGNSGSGSGTVQLVIAGNTDAGRTGTVTIAGQTFTVTQEGGCTYSLAPSSQHVGSGGGPGSFTVNAGGTCAWTATPSVGWITLSSGSSGSGTGTVQFTAAPNTGGARSGAIAVGGQVFTIDQEAGCTATVSPDTIAATAAGGPQNVQVATPGDCSWNSTSNAPWISISGAASGAGNGTVQLAIAANSGPARSGTATIAAKIVTVSQEGGCAFSISPSSVNMPQPGGTGTVTVTTADGCAWTATSSATWIGVTSGASGTGAGPVQFSVEANATGAARSGTITIGGQVFTVNQAEVPPGSFR